MASRWSYSTSPNAEFAEKLVVAESNVKSHLTSASGKLGVNFRDVALS
jgi:DNA-binding NarL/FixJ family response regulator